MIMRAIRKYCTLANGAGYRNEKFTGAWDKRLKIKFKNYRRPTRILLGLMLVFLLLKYDNRGLYAFYFYFRRQYFPFLFGLPTRYHRHPRRCARRHFWSHRFSR